MDWEYLMSLKRKVDSELNTRGVDLLAVKGVLNEAKREIYQDISRLAGKEGRKKLIVDYQGLYSMEVNFIKSSQSLVFRVGLIPDLPGKIMGNIEKYADECPFDVDVYDLEAVSESSRISERVKKKKRFPLGRYKVVGYA